jgi:hypothetical protein
MARRGFWAWKARNVRVAQEDLPNLPIPDRSESTIERSKVHSVGAILHPLRRKWPVSRKARHSQMALASLAGEYTGLAPKNPNDATRTDPGYRVAAPQHT